MYLALKTILFILLFFSSLHAQAKILALSGSSRKDSYNKKLIIEAASVAEKLGANVTVIDLKNYPMPLYDGDLEKEKGLPEYAKNFIEKVKQNSSFIIATPTYNGSIPAVLKNALDWASRSGDKNLFRGKKFALLSTSSGKDGGSKGLKHLEDIVHSLGGIVVSTKLSIPESFKAFDDKGKLVYSSQKMKLKREIEGILQ